VEDRSTVADRLPRNSYRQVCCVFVAQAASGCRWNETSADDDQRQTECVSVCMCVCLWVCVLGTCVSCAKTTKLIKMPFVDDSRGSKEPCIRWGQDRTNPFAAARGDKTTMRPFAKLLWTLVIVLKVLITLVMPYTNSSCCSTPVCIKCLSVLAARFFIRFVFITR